VMIRVEDPENPRVIDRQGNQWAPSVSLNGQYVAFSTGETGSNEVYVQEVRGEAWYRISEPEEGGTSARWSADGRWLYYQANSSLKRSRTSNCARLRRQIRIDRPALQATGDSIISFDRRLSGGPP